MLTKKQEDLLHSFFAQLDPVFEAPLYRALAAYLCELGYCPRAQGAASLSFIPKQHNKQIAKMGIWTSKKRGSRPFFALRFSACKGYSRRFADIVEADIAKYSKRAANCMTPAGCHWCAGEAATHVYSHTFPDGETKYHCGAYAIEIPDIREDDLEEIKRLIREEHAYLLKHEAGLELNP